MTLNISFVAEEQRQSALRLLFARFPVEEQQQRLSEALRSVERGVLNLDGLLIAEEDHQTVGVALMMTQQDGVTLVWPPVTTCGATDGGAVEDGLMSRLCDSIDHKGSKLAQALIAPDDSVELELLKRHGFEHLADLYFVARRLTRDDAELPNHVAEIEHDTFNEANADRFASVIERTYQQSLDCPFLDGFRSGTDALIRHRMSGSFDPAGWRLYRDGTQDLGVLMMNDHPDQDAIELVYFGIVPEFRGKGFGRRVLVDGIRAAGLTGRAVIFLAVDCGNVYANALYDELEFAEMARRRVLVRRSSQLARE